MADTENIISLILQAKDQYTGIFADYKQKVSALPQTEAEVNARWQGYMNDAQSSVERLTNDRIALAQREKNETLAVLKQSHDQGLNSAKKYSDGVVAANKKAIDSAADPSLIERVKANWLELTAAVTAAWLTVNEAMEYLDLGTKAIQTESAFSNVVDAYGIDGDRLMEKLKEVSVGAIDDSELMMRAIKALQQGLSPEQIVGLLEVARSSARIAGIDISAAFDRITEAAANQQTRGLKSMGLVIDQAKAFEDYAKKIGIATDALNEQQQSAAIADAALKEGLRQRAAMGEMLVNESERLQQIKAQYEEMKEKVGKELVGALMLALDHIDAIGVALGAAALTQAPAIIGAITSAYEALTIAAGAAEIVVSGGIIAIAAAAVAFASYLAIDSAAMSGVGAIFDDIAEQQRFLGPKLAENTLLLEDLGFKGANAQKEFNRAVKDGTVVFDEAARKWINLQQVSDAFYEAEEERMRRVAEGIKYVSALRDAESKSYQANIAFEIGLLDEQYNQGQITLASYYQQRQDLEEAAATNSIDVMEATMSELMLFPEKNAQAIIKLEAQINGAMLNYAEQKYKTEDIYAKKLEKSNADEFKNWEALQALKLTALEQNHALAAAMDEAAAAQGELSQSDMLTRKAARDAEYYNAQLQVAGETLAKIAALQGINSDDYSKALADKEKLQTEYQIRIIESETAMKDAKLKLFEEESKANRKMSTDVLEQIRLDKNAELELNMRNYNNDLIAFAEYEARKVAIEQQAAADMEAADTQYRTAQHLALGTWFNQYSAFLGDLKTAVTDAFTTEDVFSNLNYSWKNTQAILTADYKSMMSEVQQYTKDSWENVNRMIQYIGRVPMEDLYLFGRDVTNLSREQVSQWVDSVTGYVQRVQDLFAGLKDTISNYQDQLDQMRGNELAILDRWRAEETQKLKDKYGDDLANTKEYQEALTLLTELYAEKRKKILEDEAKTKLDLSAGVPPPGYTPPKAPNPYAPPPGQPPTPTAPAVSRQEIDVNWNVSLNTDNPDIQAVTRFTKEVFMPIFFQELKYRGITL